MRSAVIIKPKVRGFICTTTHPVGCEKNVLEQIETTRACTFDKAKGPKRVLVVGASSGYGLAARITAAFGYGADTLGIFFEKPGSEKKPGTAGWYNSAALDRKSTRLNSSHVAISYAVFCLKKKKNKEQPNH